MANSLQTNVPASGGQPVNSLPAGVEQVDPDKLRREMRRQCCDSLYFLAKAVIGFNDLTSDLHLDICRFIQEDKAKRKLLIVPRSHFKTTMLSISYPIWRLLPKKEDWQRDKTDGPNSRILLCSSTSTNAERFLRRIKAVFESNKMFQWLFPELIPDFQRAVKWTEKEILLPRAMQFPESSIDTIGVGGKVTSRHYTDIVKDDLIEVTIAESANELEKVTEWHEYSESLLENPDRDRDFVCGTRYNQDDLYGYLKTNDKRYKKYERKAIEEGKVIFPERFTLEAYAEMSRRKPYIYSTQYMNNPIDPSVVDFKPEWLRYYKLVNGKIVMGDGRVIDPHRLNTYILVDPAISESKHAARTAIINVGVLDQEHIFVLNAIARRMNPNDCIKAVFDLARQLRPHKVGVEVVAYQKALKFWMEQYAKKVGYYLNIVELKPGVGSKEARIRGLVNYFASGQIYIRREFTDLIDEYLAFPAAKLRDLIDALSYAPSIWTFPDTEVDDYDEFEEELEFIGDGRSRSTGY